MERRTIGRLGRALIGLTAVGALTLGAAAPVAAHAHFAENGQAGDGQVLANGQNHPRPFVALNDGTGRYASCESFSPGGAFGPAWFGLETAHHGPDSGDPGKVDGCYVADGNPALGQDDQNPAIR